MSGLNDIQAMFNQDGMGLDNMGGMRGPGNFMRSMMVRLGVDPAVSGSGGGQGGDPLAGAGCVCNSSSGALKIVCCQSGGSCAFDCGALSNPQGTMVLGACGGNPPYTWATTKGTIAESGSNQATLTKPVNTGSGVAGVAYKLFIALSTDCGVQGGRNYVVKSVGCNDIVQSCPTASWFAPCCEGPCNNLSGTGECPNGTGFNCGQYSCILPVAPVCSGSQNPMFCAVGTICTDLDGSVCDLRTAAMIAAGCAPCKASMAGAVVTVTDSSGASVSKTITT